MEVVDQALGRDFAPDAGTEPADPPPLQLVPWLRVRSFGREDAVRVVRLTLVGELRARSRRPNGFAGGPSRRARDRVPPDPGER